MKGKRILGIKLRPVWLLTTKKSRRITELCIMFTAIFCLFQSCENQFIIDILPKKKEPTVIIYDSIAITPDAGQSKVYGTIDPEFTYTVSGQLNDGDSFRGALSRVPGEIAGTYAITLGTLSAGSEYVLTLNGAIEFEIFKAEGVPVDGEATLFGVSSPGNITINEVVITGNPGGQAVEYAVSTEADGTGLSGWQYGVVFSGLEGGKNYYVYSRSAGNINYCAGAYNVSAPLRFYTLTFYANGAGGTEPAVIAVLPGTEIIFPSKGTLIKDHYFFDCWNTNSDGSGDRYISGQTFTVTENKNLFAKWIGEQTFPFQFELPINNAPIVSGITISQTGNGGYPVTAKLEIKNSNEYDSIEWLYGSLVFGTGRELLLDAKDILYNALGIHNITARVWKNGVPYSRVITFVVVL